MISAFVVDAFERAIPAHAFLIGHEAVVLRLDHQAVAVEAFFKQRQAVDALLVDVGAPPVPAFGEVRRLRDDGSHDLHRLRAAHGKVEVLVGAVGLAAVNHANLVLVQVVSAFIEEGAAMSEANILSITENHRTNEIS